MTLMGRRQFCALLGAGVAGLSVVLAGGCSDEEGRPAAGPADGGGTLAGLSFEVRRDPG